MDSSPAPQVTDRPPDGALAAAFARELEHALGAGGLSPAEAAFTSHMVEDCSDDEAAQLSAADLTTLALDFWTFAGTRAGSGPQVRIAPADGAGGRSLDLMALQIVQDDAPFLVDSVMGEVTEGGYVVKAMFHPVVEVSRDASGARRNDRPLHRESMILVLFEPGRWFPAPSGC